MEPGVEVQQPGSVARAWRALAVMAASALAIGAVGFAYLHPAAPRGPTTLSGATAHRLVGIDFVSPSTGWVLVEGSRDFVILRTTDAGKVWSRQLGGGSGNLGEYMHFFDQSHGVVVALGPNAVLFKTDDGGKTWGVRLLDEGRRDIVSVVFPDARHGWMLAMGPARNEHSSELLATKDGGMTWVSLGDPVLPEDFAYRVVFSDATRGWLYSLSSGPYAYATTDGGISWRRVTVPTPPEGWLGPTRRSETPTRFLVAARPTLGSGVMATVIAMADLWRRDAQSPDYVPLTVRGFETAGTVMWIYPRFGDPNPYRFLAYDSAGEPVQYYGFRLSVQVQLTSDDEGATWTSMSPPSSIGAIGYFDPINWWWIGLGRWSTSSNGGRTWAGVQSLGVPEPLPGSLQVLDAAHAWFGAMAGSRPLLEGTADGGTHWSAYPLPPISSA